MNERRMKIIEACTKNAQISVSSLSSRFGVSQVTIRTDLKALEEEGLLRRVHGGAASVSDEVISNRLNRRYETKLHIAAEAAELVASGETVMIESGSTNALLARRLGETKDVTIITNSCFIAHFVRDLPRLRVVLLGGDYQPASEVCVGPLTRQGLQAFHVDKVFLGTDGFSEEDGFTCMDLQRAEVMAAMAARGNRTFILTDSSKFDQRGVAGLPLESVDTVVTDSGIPETVQTILKRSGVSLLVAEQGIK